MIVQQLENQEKAWTLRQQEVHYTPLSVTRGKACATCRWFNPYGDYRDNVPIASCHLVDSYPEPILATGLCDRHETKPVIEPPEVEPIPVVIVEPEAVEVEMAYATPTPISGLMPAIKRLLGYEQPQQTVLKGVDGLRYMVIFTSNGYADRELEHVATRALKAYVDGAWLSDGAWVGDNVHLYWHDKNLVMGAIVWADMLDGFLCEVSREDDTPIAKALWDSVEGGKDVHGASHGFRFDPRKKEAGVYNHIRKYETSSLPVEAAANIGTLSEVIKDMKTREQRLDEIFGLDGAAKILTEEGPKGLNKRLAERGVKPKSVDAPAATNLNEPTAAEKTVERQDDNFAGLVITMAESLADLHAAQEGIKQKAVDDATAQQTLIQQQAATITGLGERVGTLEAQLKLAPRRASTADETALTPEQIKALKPEAEIDTFFPSDMQAQKT